jgi:hypothetical protein
MLKTKSALFSPGKTRTLKEAASLAVNQNRPLRRIDPLEFRLQSNFKATLPGKSVLVKISLFSRAFSGTIVAVDETGFCLDSEAMVAALRESTGTLMAAIDAPTVYLTFASLEWMVSSQPKAAAANA